MQIQAKSERDAGKRILCNGKFFVVGKDGALCLDGTEEPADLEPADADKLLQNSRVWEPYGTPRGRAPGGRPPGARIQLIDKHGQILEREEPTQPRAMEPPAELEQSTVPPILPPALPPDLQAPAPVADTPAEPQECSPSPGDTGAGEALSAPQSNGDPPIPAAEGEEWADPKPTYSLKWLRACARAYEVKFGPRSSAETLCANITAAMYGSEEQTT